MSIFYLILSLILFIILAPIGILYGLATNIKGQRTKLIRAAESIDRLGNVMCSELFNDALLKDSKNPFGYGWETISSALGRNVQAGTLSRTGRAVNGVLNKIEKDHAVRNIGY